MLGAIGEVRLFVFHIGPQGWLGCHGETVNVQGYEGLAGVLDDTFAQNYEVFFRVPSLDEVTAADGRSVGYFICAEGFDPTYNIQGFIGEVKLLAFSSLPSGWLPCDGSTVERNDQPDLYDVVGLTYGGEDFVNTFALPDLAAPPGMQYAICASGIKPSTTACLPDACAGDIRIFAGSGTVAGYLPALGQALPHSDALLEVLFSPSGTVPNIPPLVSRSQPLQYLVCVEGMNPNPQQLPVGPS